MPLVDHVDLVVSDLERSLRFYRGLLAPLGWVAAVKQEGERGETIRYLGGPDLNGSLGLREAQSKSDKAVDRYAVGLHHLAFEAPQSRRGRPGLRLGQGAGRRDRRRARGAPLHAGLLRDFFFDPDGIKLEVVHRPRPFSLSFARGLVHGVGFVAAQLQRRRLKRTA